MSRNHMADVAKMLGVELDEEFGIMGRENTKYRIDIYGLWMANKEADNWHNTDNFMEKLLTGELIIKKKPWKPKMGERYWAIGTTGKPSQLAYSDDFLIDILNVRTGNFFKTEEEAEANVDNFLEYINQEPDLSWRVK